MNLKSINQIKSKAAEAAALRMIRSSMKRSMGFSAQRRPENASNRRAICKKKLNPVADVSVPVEQLVVREGFNVACVVGNGHLVVREGIVNVLGRVQLARVVVAIVVVLVVAAAVRAGFVVVDIAVALPGPRG